MRNPPLLSTEGRGRRELIARLDNICKTAQAQYMERSEGRSRAGQCGGYAKKSRVLSRGKVRCEEMRGNAKKCEEI